MKCTANESEKLSNVSKPTLIVFSPFICDCAFTAERKLQIIHKCIFDGRILRIIQHKPKCAFLEKRKDKQYLRFVKLVFETPAWADLNGARQLTFFTSHLTCIWDGMWGNLGATYESLMIYKTGERKLRLHGPNSDSLNVIYLDVSRALLPNELICCFHLSKEN